MRILYVANIGRLNSAGVVNKVIAKTESLVLLGLDIKAIVFYTEKTSSVNIDILNSRVEFMQYSHALQFFDLLTDYLKKNQDPNLIFLRYPLASSQLLNFIEKQKGKVIFEHNTKETDEILTRIKSFSIRDYLYMLRSFSFKPVVSEWRSYLAEKKMGPRILSHARGGVAVTQEIADYEMRRSPAYSTAVVSNGVDTEEINILPDLTFNGINLTLMVLSASVNHWHGIDRLLEGIKVYKGKGVVKLLLVGSFNMKVKRLAAEIKGHEINFTGLLPQKEIFSLSKEVHLGIGSLALHRIPLYQGCVLKVREYLAMGLPVVYGYDDVDLISDESKKYSVKIPADESAVDIESLFAFAEKVYKTPESRSHIREFAVQTVDVSVKMRLLKQALESF